MLPRRATRLLALGLLLAPLVLAGCVGDTPAREREVGRDVTPLPGEERLPPANGTLRIHYVNVGQGDAAIWELPDGTVVLFDCGPPASAPDTNPVTRYLRNRLGLAPGATVHAVIASHGHLDHIGGCQEVFQEYRVTRVYEGWYDGTDAPRSYQIFRDEIKVEGAAVHTAAPTATLNGEIPFKPGDPVALPEPAEAAGVGARILAPGGLPTDWDAIAEASLVARLSFGNVDACFQGDIETEQEEALAAAMGERDCEVYLAGHHGSRHASTSAWLARLDPEVAVVSFGENSYGHPTSEALCRIQQQGAKVYATHRAGSIIVETDGRNLTVTPDTPETRDYCAPGASYWSDAPTGAAPAPAPPEEHVHAEAGDFQLAAAVSNPAPCQRTPVTVSVSVRDESGAPVEDANVTTTWRYKTTAPTESAVTNGTGIAEVTRNVGGASIGYTVRIDVAVRKGALSGTTSAEFTTGDC